MINILSKQLHENNKAKGFYEDEKNIGEMLCLIHSEVSEALEADRKNSYADLDKFNSGFHNRVKSYDIAWKEVFELHIKDTFKDELADVMIRVMDLAAFKKINLEKHIELKMFYNSLRAYKHGKKY